MIHINKLEKSIQNIFLLNFLKISLNANQNTLIIDDLVDTGLHAFVDAIFYYLNI